MCKLKNYYQFVKNINLHHLVMQVFFLLETILPLCDLYDFIGH